jgi:hypothetical protein
MGDDVIRRRSALGVGDLDAVFELHIGEEETPLCSSLFPPQIPIQCHAGDVEIAADVLHRHLSLLVELTGKDNLAGIAWQFGSSAMPASRSGSLQACLGSLPDDVPLEFSQRPENVEDELSP